MPSPRQAVWSSRRSRAYALGASVRPVGRYLVRRGIAPALGDTDQDLWRTQLGTPALGGLAVSGDWLAVATYDGAVRGFAAASRDPVAPAPISCAPASGGCCDAGREAPAGALVLALIALVAVRRRPT